MSSLILPAKTATAQIECACTVCKGRHAEVPIGMLGHSKPGTKSHRTVIHNLVCIAWSPMGIGANIVRIKAAPSSLVATQAILEALLLDSWRIPKFHAVDLGDHEWALVATYSDGHWVLTADSVLSWYPGDSFVDDSGPGFTTVIDATTPQYVAEAAHDIMTAPADQRAYIAAVNGPNVPQSN